MTILSPRVTRAAVPAREHAGPIRRLGPNATITIAANDPGPAVATVTGELDLACAGDLAAVLCCALDESVPGLSLDLAGVGFFDCAAYRALRRCRHHAEERGRPLLLKRSSPAVERVLDVVERF